MPTDRWLEVRVRPDAAGDDAQRAALVAALVEWGSAGVIEEGVSLVGYLPPEADPTLIRASLARADARAQIELAPCVVGDWSERWREGVRAHAVGSLRVAPPWLAGPGDQAHTIVIDPGMAFGTGEHATTRGMLRLLSTVVRPGDFVADLGTGSGVLAIAAVKLGAARVAAIEVDPDAVPNAQANVEANDVADRIAVLAGDARALLPLVAPVRVITANIVSSTIIELLPIIEASLDADGCTILGGILVEERAAMREILEGRRWCLGMEDVEGEWWSIIAERP